MARRRVLSFIVILVLAGTFPLLLSMVPKVKAAYLVPGDFDNIQDAINNADINVSDEIAVAPGFTNDGCINVSKPWKIYKWPLTDLEEATILGDGISAVVTLSANNTEISGFTIRNGGLRPGIAIQNATSGHLISHNNITGNSAGIYPWGPTGRSTIHSNLIEGNQLAGILVSGWGHNISHNTIIDDGVGIEGTVQSTVLENNTIRSCHGLGGEGIALRGSNNTVRRNLVVDTVGPAIYLGPAALECFNNTIENNVISDNSFGIQLFNATSSFVAANNVNHSSECAVKLHSCTFNAIFDNTITGLSFQNEGVHLYSSNNNTVTLSSVANCYRGIYLQGSKHNNVSSNYGLGNRIFIDLLNSSHNSVAQNEVHMELLAQWGVRLTNSSENHIKENTIASVQNGILLNSSNLNTLTSNNVYRSTAYGIYITQSEGNSLTGNLLDGNGYNFAVWGSHLSHFNHSIDASNKVDARSILYLKNERGPLQINNDTLPYGIGYLALINCTAVTVKNLDPLKRNGQGILVVATNDSAIEAVKFQDNYYGVYMLWSSNNTVSRCSIWTEAVDGARGIFVSSSTNLTLIENGISRNEIGISLVSSTNLNITHNNVQHNLFAAYLRDSSQNVIYNNNFADRRQITIDYLPNSWNYSDIGNYWHEWLGDPPYNITVNNLDYHPLDHPLMRSLTGDFDWDGDVDIYDIVMMAGAYGTIPGDKKWNPFVDLITDWEINIYDVVLACDSYGESW